MPEMLQVVEELRQQEASVQRLFGGDGSKVRNRRQTPEHLRQVRECAEFVEQVASGRRPMYHLQEAMSTSDFPVLFADVLDRQLLGAYRETSPTWQAYARRSVVPDFRNVERFALDGAESVLPEVEELEEYPEASLEETSDSYRVRKYGRRLDLSWEAMINDDLDAFRRNPERLARAARRSESRFATTLFVDASGPHASLYTGGFGNVITGDPELSVDALQQALILLSAATDNDGEPILVELVHLVIPPALEVPARNILNATELELSTGLSATTDRMRTVNWMKNRLQLHVEPYIPHVANTANGSTSWFLFADPGSGRVALEMGFLRGHEDPALYERAPDARRVGGGDVMESFTDDSVAWRIRHVMGGGRLTTTGGANSTVASDGSGGPAS